MIRLHRSNRAEELAGMLAEVLERPLADPLAREYIVVQSRGMERWLEMQLADAHGICAGVEFLFPRRFLRERLFAPLLGVDADLSDAFEPARLCWEIAALLPGLVANPAFEPVARYLVAEPGARRRLALSSRIAQVFDDYAIYRPDWVRGWERGAEPRDWQAELWRALVARCGPLHSAELVARAQARLADAAPAALPERVCVFGLSSLPPLFAEAFAALARVSEVHVFLLSPARDARGIGALGAAGFEFEQRLASLGARALEERFVEPQGGGLLQLLQSGLARGAPPANGTRGADVSLSLHVCHGPMREAEVVRDQILDAFSADPSLRLEDVAILVPDVGAYGPLLEAVFASYPDHELRVSVADRSPLESDELVQVLSAVIRLARGRVTSSEVMDLLARDAVRERFGFAPADLELIRAWVERSGIRWGVDAEHRAAEGQPALAQNTWRRGLDRLWLGWAAGAEGRLQDVVAEPVAAAAPGELLGRFAEFCEAIFELRERLRVEHPPKTWSRELQSVLDRLTRPRGAEQIEQQRRLRGALEQTSASAQAAGFAEAIPLEAYWLEAGRALGDAARAPAHALPSGAISVCELVPMRAIPFRVIALVGLGDEAFPRRETRADFDRMAGAPEPGDPVRRSEDRQLFLEVLASARDRLILTVPGRSPRDGAVLPHSVVVDELLEALDLDRERFPVQHPLYPFSSRYFSGEERLFSFDARARNARAQAQAASSLPRPFLDAELPPDPEPAGEIALEELERFLRHPARWFCQRRLGLYLGPEDEPLEEREPLELDSLERWRIGSELLAARLAGRCPDTELELARLRGELPPGRLGECVGQAIVRRADSRWRDVQARRRTEASGWLEIDGELAGRRIRGRIGGLDSDGSLVAVQYGALERPREIGVWVRHVLANWSRGSTNTWLFGEGSPSVVRFAPVASAGAILSEWLDWMERSRRRPIPLFASASRVYAEAIARGSRAKALERARREFEQPGHGGRPAGESFDPYVELVTRGRSPLDAEFEDCSRQLFSVLLAHRGDGV